MSADHKRMAAMIIVLRVWHEPTVEAKVPHLFQRA
jgi:hypothetical protein